MKTHLIATARHTIGVDLGDKRSHLCVLDAEGQIANECTITTSPAAFRKHFLSAPSALVVLEVGQHSRWASNLLAGLGHEVLVANAGRVSLIHQSDRKNDRLDARNLAKLARVDPSLLSPITHRDGSAQASLSVIRARDVLVRARTALINCVRGLVKPTGLQLPSCASAYFVKKVGGLIPEALLSAITPLLEQLDSLSNAIFEYDEKIAEIARTERPETARLEQVTEVGTLTALAFVLTISDPHRFPKSRQVGSYFGLRPRQDQSGERSPQLGISKAGDHYLRRLLVGSAQYILGRFGPDTDLRRWGLKLAERGGKSAKKRAVVAVARKLAVLLHRLWITGAVYEALRNTQKALVDNAAA
jgi:transposase